MHGFHIFSLSVAFAQLIFQSLCTLIYMYINIVRNYYCHRTDIIYIATVIYYYYYYLKLDIKR